MSDLLDFDRRHLWHPYTSIVDPLPTYEAVSAEGVRIRLSNGDELIDGMSSWWCAIHGYGNQIIVKAIEDQVDKMAHVMFGGLTHEPAVELARRLITLTPKGLDHVFLSDSGSVSVEVAIKMGLQYWQSMGVRKKNRLLTIRGGYHGDTFGAMSVCDPVTGMHSLFKGFLPEQVFAPQPLSRFGETLSKNDRDLIRKAVSEHSDELAAIIVEPIVQGAGGMWFYSSGFLLELEQLCQTHDILLIFDEIATGFGRTGKMFACEHADVTPDIMCLGKAMTGGYLSQAATLANTRVAEGISQDAGVLMHGPTFMANPTAAAAAIASIDLLLDSDWSRKVLDIESQLKFELARYAKDDRVKDVRILGAIGVIQTHKPVDVAEAQRRLVKRGVWIRHFGNLIYLMPPYIIESRDLTKLTESIECALSS